MDMKSWSEDCSATRSLHRSEGAQSTVAHPGAQIEDAAMPSPATGEMSLAAPPQVARAVSVHVTPIARGRMPDWCDAYLAATGDGDIFASRLWYDTMLAHALPSACRPLLALAGDGGMLLPLALGRAGMRALTTPYSLEWRPLPGPGCAPAVAGTAMGHWLRYSRPLRLDAVSQEAGGLEPFLSGASAQGIAVMRHRHFGNWREVLANGAGWAGYLAVRPAALVTTIRRKVERARRELRFEHVTGGRDALVGAIADYEAVRARSWKPTEAQPAFDGALIHAAAAQGCLRMGVLRTPDGTAIAAQYWLLSGGRAWLLKLCHDEASRSFSPGTVLTALMIRRLIEEDDVRELDFGRGDDAYKQLWVGQRRQRIGLTLADPWHPLGLLEVGRRRLAGLLGRPGMVA